MPRRPTPLLPSLFPKPMLNRRRLLGGGLAVAAVAGSLTHPAQAQAGEVNVLNWDTYIGPDTLQAFSAATGIDVRYDLFASNDELFGRLREGNPGYDVIYPTHQYVARMAAAGMLIPLDHAKIPNMANLDPYFMDPAFDPGRQHSLPYFWGTMGIGYRRSVVSPTSWAELFAPEAFSGRVSLLNDNNIIRMALVYLGFSLNTQDAEQIEAAVQLLIRAKPHIKTFAPDTGQDLLIAGEVDLCMEWNGDILQVMQEDDDLSYVVPDEGSMRWEDAMAIVQGAPNPDEAHAWINFILDADVHAAIASHIKYPLPNAAAKALIPAEDLENPAIYPSDEVLAKLQVQVYQGEEIESLYENALTRVLAA